MVAAADAEASVVDVEVEAASEVVVEVTVATVEATVAATVADVLHMAIATVLTIETTHAALMAATEVVAAEAAVVEGGGMRMRMTELIFFS